MINSAVGIRSQWAKEQDREKEKYYKAISRSKKRNKFFIWIEYLYLLTAINCRARIFHLSGYTKYTKHYIWSEKTINNLKNNGFMVWTDKSVYGVKMQINW